MALHPRFKVSYFIRRGGMLQVVKRTTVGDS
jgi:hypothetical protein